MSGYLARPIMDRFLEACIPEPNSGCWLWLLSLRNDGYGAFAVRRNKSRPAHQISFELFKGGLPRKSSPFAWVIMHTCDNKVCVNPDHLKLATQQENIRDSMRKGRSRMGTHFAVRTHCINGHPFDVANEFRRSDGGGRGCRECSRLRQEQYRIRKAKGEAA